MWQIIGEIIFLITGLIITAAIIVVGGAATWFVLRGALNILGVL